MFRFVLGIFLVAIGVSSPWLVRDWLHSEGDRKAATKIANALEGWADQLRGEGDVDVVEEASPRIADSGSEGKDQTLSEVPPYPLATTTVRFLKGLLPSSLATSGRELSLPSTRNVSERIESDEVLARLSDGLGRMGMKGGDPVFVRVFKEEGELELWMRKEGESDFSLFKVYRLAHRSGGPGPKRREGDLQSPEGFYEVGSSSLRPETRHRLGIDLGYPNDFDRASGRTGSGMMIHGGDGSAGSFVLAPEEMAEVFALTGAALRNGQPGIPVHSFPFRMTDKRMEEEWRRQPEWIAFWKNLKEGYDFFENVGYPPEVSSAEGNYSFHLH